MFPIPFNFPFRKKDGSISTIGNEMENGGSAYVLPTASADVKGGVKIGTGLTMDGEVLKNTNPTPATPYVLPVASANVLGGVKIGSGVNIDENGVISVSGGSGGGGTTSLTAIAKGDFPYTATAKGFVMINAIGPASTGTTYYFGVSLNDVKLMSPSGDNYYAVQGGKIVTMLLPVNVGDIIGLTGNPTQLSNFASYFIAT